jgi:2-oxo-4-hydroxy-4-carboxy-5-ureidoimidazoline decarboxylase
MNIANLNQLSAADAAAVFERCCGSRRWVERMLALRPFPDAEHLLAAANRIWQDLGEGDWLEAFSHHPKIGDIDALRSKFASTAAWASQEQSGTARASDATLHALRDGNALYEQKNGFIFIICATGKSADEMLQLLQARLKNDRTTELRNAAQEQAKITQIRLEKALS